MNVVINLNKPKDISSQQAVIKVKGLFAARKAGHAGSLDPIATGVLIVCLNEATKTTRFLSDLDKEYIVRLKLGERTDTYDLTGRIVDKTDCLLLKEADIHRVLNNFIGRIKQTPPMYSAIKIGGKPLYKLARRGMDIKRPDRTINIYGIDLIGFKQPYLDLKISCSKGTYIRTLCDDIGKSLGVGAHMVSLERTRVGKFRIEDSVSLEELKYKFEGDSARGTKSPLRAKTTCNSIDSAISHLNEIILDEGSYHKAKNGMPIITTEIPLHPPLLRGGRRGLQINQYVRLKGPKNNLFGIGRVERDRIKIERLLNI
ncbi:MAG: tRNA pseudouridine(55) synthase TruB [Nitrospirota bacterium]